MKLFGLAIHWIIHEGSEPVLINKVGKINTFENIAKSDKQGKIPIIIRNLSPTQILIRRGSPICKLSTFEILKEIKNIKDLESLVGEDIETESINLVTCAEPWKPSEILKFQNKDLTKDQVSKIKELVDEFWMCFSRNDQDIGCIKSDQGNHDIKLINDTIPIRQRPYKIPYAKEKVVEECVEKMLKMGVI